MAMGISIEPRSSGLVVQPQRLAPPDLAARLEKFLDLLDLYKTFIEDAPSVRETAAALRSEIRKPSPNWGLVRGLLRGIAASAGGVAALTDAVNNIQNLIRYTFR